MAAVSILPFVAYSSATEALVPAEEWEGLYASLQALKAHVQEYPGCQRFDVFVRAEDSGDMGAAPVTSVRASRAGQGGFLRSTGARPRRIRPSQ